MKTITMDNMQPTIHGWTNFSGKVQVWQHPSAGGTVWYLVISDAFSKKEIGFFDTPEEALVHYNENKSSING